MKKIIVLIVVLMGCRAQGSDGDYVLQFDNPFPQSPYKGFLTACMRVRSALEMVQMERENRAHVDLLCDVVAGRLVRLEAQLEQVVPHSVAVHAEDAAYLDSIFSCMVQEAVHAQQLQANPDDSFLYTLAKRVHQKAAQIFGLPMV